MKTDELDAILEECLHNLQSGGSVESCLARYPEAVEDLRPLLLTAQAIQAVFSPHVSLAAREAGLSRMLSSANPVYRPKRSSHLKQLGKITAKTTVRFVLGLSIVVIVLTWLVSLWQQQADMVDEVPEILPSVVTEAPAASNTPPPPLMEIATASPRPTNIPTAVFTETPTPTVPSIVSPVPSPTNQPVTNDTVPLPPPVELNDGTALTIVPENPTTADTIEIFVAGTGACSTVPVYQFHQINKNVIQIEARRSGRDTVCAAVITDWDFSLFLDPLPAGEYRIEFFVSQDETRELWGREFITIVLLPTAVPTLTCDERLLAEGQYLILLDETHFVDGVTEHDETVTQVVERLTAKYEAMVRFVWESLPGFSVQNLSSEAAAALATEPEVISVDPNLCVSGAGE